jgi:hypothetical protein
VIANGIEKAVPRSPISLLPISPPVILPINYSGKILMVEPKSL